MRRERGSRGTLQVSLPKLSKGGQYTEKWKTTVLQRHRYKTYCCELTSRGLKVVIGIQSPEVQIENENCHKQEMVLRGFLEERDKFPK